eukprot:364983-Chlamydomonas_euryale.AAC.9
MQLDVNSLASAAACLRAELRKVYPAPGSVRQRKCRVPPGAVLRSFTGALYSGMPAARPL